MSADLFLRNARIVLEDREVEGGVVVSGGRITEIVPRGSNVSARETIDVKGRHLLPGVVDSHVHFNQPGRDHWEGFRTGTMAAAAGGVTTVLDMPLNCTPPTIDVEQLERKIESVRGDAYVDYGLWGGLVDDNVAALAGLHGRGVVAFKGFMSSSGVDYERLDDDLIYASLLESRRVGCVIGLHAENEHVTARLSRELQAAGRIDRAAWPESRPPACELEAIRRACFWAGVAGGNLHIVHVSTADGVRAITEAKRAGVNVTAETCPHYLFFDQVAYERIGPAAKCAPPLRSREIVEELWGLVLAGEVDTIGSDHSPCSWDEKAPGMDNIWLAWGGISGVQTTLPVLLTEGVHRRGLGLSNLMRMLAGRPARLYGLYPRKGAIRVGADADFAIVDLDRQWTLQADDLMYRNRHSPFVGSTFLGRVDQTIVRGQTVYRDGEVTGQPGYGQLIRRAAPSAA
jgi:allantoinase